MTQTSTIPRLGICSCCHQHFELEEDAPLICPDAECEPGMVIAYRGEERLASFMDRLQWTELPLGKIWELTFTARAELRPGDHEAHARCLVQMLYVDEHREAGEVRYDPACQCWNQGEWGRVHREDCPIHRLVEHREER